MMFLSFLTTLVILTGIITCQTCSCLASPYLLLVLFLGLLPNFLQLWPVPGGFAWRNHRPGISSSILRGPSGWPILGFIPHMGPLAHRNLASLAATHDARALMAFSLGTTRVVISSDPETAREILYGPKFSSRPVKCSARALMFERALGFAPAGEYWRHLRRVAATHMFSPRRISAREGVWGRITDDMVTSLEGEMREKGFVEVRVVLRAASERNMVGSVFGDRIWIEWGRALADMVREGYEVIVESNWEDYFNCGFGLLDFRGVKKRCDELAMRVRVVIGEIIEERRRVGIGCGDDFLTALLSMSEEDRLSHSDMTAVLWEMLFRGIDTVAVLLEWIIARMVLHPDIQTKAQQELDSCVGKYIPQHPDRRVRDSDMPNLPYLQAIVKESLRLHPPGPLLSWARLATEDARVGKFLVPAGTTAMVNMWAIAHDSDIWTDPWEFRPERFLGEDVSVMGTDLRLAPFGSGRRVCPGRVMGLATVHMWLGRLLQRFRWVPVAGQGVDLSEHLKLSLEMEKPLICRAIPRT